MSPVLKNIPIAIQSGLWSVWRAQPNQRNPDKIIKVPYATIIPTCGISTKNQDEWVHYDDTLAFYKQHHKSFNGLAYLVGSVANIIIVDIDNCITDKKISKHATDIIKALNSYTEVSPSGNGIRIIVKGEPLPTDVVNREIEIYSGNSPRFATITGRHVKGTPTDVNDSDKSVLDDLYQRYKSNNVVSIDINTPIPELLALSPDTAKYTLDPECRRWLDSGFEDEEDRSRALTILAHRLYHSGMTDETVFNLMYHNEHCFNVAVDHWGESKAEQYIWKHHCLSARHANPLYEFAKYGNKKPRPRGFTLIHANDLSAMSRSIDWLIEPYIETNSLGLLFGDPGSYKSFLALDIAVHCAFGKDWHGNKVTPGAVIYIAGEGHSGLERRLQAVLTKNNLTINDSIPFHFSSCSAEMLSTESIQEVTAAISTTAEKFGNPVLVVIDTLARNFGAGDENSTVDMNKFIDNIDKNIKESFGCTTLIVHHTGHTHKERARGSKALKAALDFEYRVEKESNSGSKHLAKFVNTKMKDAEQPEDIWFEGEQIIVGEFEDNVTSLAFTKVEKPEVVEDDEDDENDGNLLQGKQKEAFDLIEKIANRGVRDRQELTEKLVTEKLSININAARLLIRELLKKGAIIDIDGGLFIDDWAKNQ